MTDQVEQDIELNDDENVVEAHDPKNAEDQSVAATKAAEGAGKTAATRKGDKKNSDKSDLKAAKMAAEDVDFSEDLDALVNEEATLSEGFREKASVIFEAALNSKLQEEVNRLEESYEVRLQEEIDTTKSDLVEKVDGYLNYVVENWMEENKLAIKNGLRSEIAEGFMTKLKDLFEESYVDVPDAKVDLVDDLSEQVEALEAKLNAQTSDLIEKTSELELFQRYEVIREHSRGLAETEVEKLATLAEEIEFVSEDAFSAKVKTIKESYFKKAATTDTLAEEFETEESFDAEVEVSGSMSAYVNAIKKSQK